MSIEDAHALKVMEDRAIAIDGHYELPLLWKVENPTLPKNREMALKQLNHLKRRLVNDKDLYEKYDEKIKEHQRKGYAKRLILRWFLNTSTMTTNDLQCMSVIE